MTPVSSKHRWAALPAHDGRDPEIRIFQVAAPAIQWLVALVEAYEGIGLVRTLDEHRGLIECWIMPDFVKEFSGIIDTVSQQWPMQPIEWNLE